MINYYKKSKREFKKYIKEHKEITREEWDEYAHKNYLFSAFTLACHTSIMPESFLLSESEFEKLKSKIKWSF